MNFRLTISFELQVLNILCNTANIVNALFPIQCFSLNQDKQFKLIFEFDRDRLHRKPGILQTLSIIIFWHNLYNALILIKFHLL